LRNKLRFTPAYSFVQFGFTGHDTSP
jgi:hypothetical protein